MIGDVVLDTLGGAARESVEAYEAAFKRRPTRAEWEASLLAVLGAEEPKTRGIDEGLVKRVRLDGEP